MALLLLLAGGWWMTLARRPLEKPLPTPQSHEARRLALRGYIYLRAGTARDLRNAIEYFNLAISADPGDAPARAALSLACSKLLETETAPVGELLLLARSQAQEALRLDKSLAEAHHALAQSLILSDHAWEAARKEFLQALAIDPPYTEARYAYAHICLTPRGLYDEAAGQLKEGLKHDPLSSMLSTELASIDIKRGRLDQAIDRLRESLSRHPNSPGTLTHLATALLAKSQDRAALSLLSNAHRSLPNDPWIASYLALCYLRLGEQASANAILQEFLTLTPTPDSSIAAIYAAIGNKDAAFEHLERAYAAHSMKLLWLAVDRRFESLRGDPRFLDLLVRMQLPH
jgi:serine/threonine-protein kinase